MGKLPETYRPFLKWIEETGNQILEPTPQTYSKGNEKMGDSLQDWFIEIRTPVAKSLFTLFGILG
jgi:hypothetical protein